MKCIICLQEAPPSCEHVISYALGGGLTIDRVCESCNNLLGNTVDDPLSQHFLIYARRAALGLQSSRGNAADMAKTLLGGEATIDGNPSARVSVSADEQGGITDIRIKPHVDVSRDAATGALSIAAMFDPRDLGFAEAKIRNALRDFGCSAEEIADVLPRAMSSMTPVSHETPPLLQYQKTLRIGDHERGLLKIAYELAWYWLGDQYLMDAKAFLLRDVLLGKRPLQDVEGTINGESVKSLALWDEEDRRHVAFLLNTGGRYFLHLRLFDVFQLTIVLSDDPLVYRHPDRDVLLFCPTARTFTESTLVKEIAAFVQRANQ